MTPDQPKTISIDLVSDQVSVEAAMGTVTYPLDSREAFEAISAA